MTSFAATEAGEMPGYLFYPAADLAQDRIWKSTVEKWGEQQAETYIRGLHAHLQDLCKTRLLWRSLPQALAVRSNLASRAYFSRYQHHYVFFRELSGDRIGIMSILHERMDLPARLAEDLAMIARKTSEEH